MQEIRVTIMGAASAFVAIMVSACGDGDVSTTGTPPAEPQDTGIYRFTCWNLNADPTEGEDNRNYYWDNVSGTPTKKKDAQFTPCVEVDDVETWDLDVDVRPKCSELCMNNNDYPVDQGPNQPQCLDQNWSSVEWDANYATCPNPTPLLDFGVIEDILGAPAAADAEELPCDLADTCLELLDHDARHAMSVASWPNVRYTAEELMETDVTQVSTVEVLGQDSDMVGEAAFTALECGEGACPFYLAQFDLDATSTLTVSVPYGAGSLTKFVSGIGVSLDHPALGLWLPDSGDVIFPSGALAIRVNAVVTSISNGIGNGSYDTVYYPQEYVFGTIDGGALTLFAEGEDVLGTWLIEGNFVPE